MLDTTKPQLTLRLCHLKMVPEGGLEPSLLSEEDFESAMEKNDYLRLLKVYNRKSIPSQISKHLGLTNLEVIKNKMAL